MMAPPNIQQLFQDLIRCQQNKDSVKGLSICKKLLESQPDNLKVKKCIAIFKIHAGHFEEALENIKDNNTLSAEMIYEKAYCEYRLNNIVECIDLLKNCPDEHKYKELLAQAYYRLEKYQECYDVYLDMMKHSDDEFEDERETNLSAVIASLEKKDHSSIGEQTFELCYNKACIYLQNGQFQQAIEQLERAEDMCRKTLEEEGCTEEEIDAELGIINAQMGYACQRLNKNDNALKIYNLVLKKKPDDGTIVAVTSNNIVTINRDQNIFDSKKKMKSAVNEISNAKLNSFQKISIMLNNCLLLIQTNQIDLCRKQLESFRSMYPSMNYEANQLEVACLSKEKSSKDIGGVFTNFIKNKDDFSTLLMYTHFLLVSERLKEASSVLKSLLKDSYKLALVSSLIKLYYLLKDDESALKFINESITWYKKNKSQSIEIQFLYEECAKIYLSVGKPQKAVDLLLECRKLNPTKHQIFVQLIMAYSQMDSKKANELMNDLPPMENLISSVDVEQLETSNWSLGTKYVKKSAKTDEPTKTEKASKKKNKKKKKKRYPKNMDSTVDPDPERWLPRWQRSTYRKKKDRKNPSSQLRGTQGSVVNDADPNIKPTNKQRISNQSSSTNQPHQSSRPRIAQKKKKKPGRR